MNTPDKYQYGSLTRRKRIRTEDVWEYRYYETTPEVGETKTEASRLPLPVDPRLADAFKEHRGRSVHQGPSDFVFANRAGKARWQESILQRQIKPAALGAGIVKFGWQTFRHSYSSLLRRVGADNQSPTRTAAALDHSKHDECLQACDAGGYAGREQRGGAERIAT